MPQVNGYGCSEVTAAKQDAFRYLLRCHMRITAKALAANERSRRAYASDRWWNWRYHFIDLTAGPGDCRGLLTKQGEPMPYEGPGSPLIFLEEAYSEGTKYDATFFEQCSDTACALQEATAGYPSVSVVNEDFRVGLGRIARCGEGLSKYGLMYYDPSGTVPQVEEIRSVLGLAPWSTVDLLMNISATTIKRVRGAFQDKPTRAFSEIIDRIGKRHWIIRETPGRWQFALVLGSNIRLNGFRRKGFYDLRSQEGEAIIERLDKPASQQVPRTLFEVAY